MRKKTVMAWWAAVTLVLTMLLCESTALAATTPVVTMEATFGDTTVGIKGRYTGETMKLFIPGTWDITSVKTDLNGKEKYIVGKQYEIGNGDVDYTELLDRTEYMSLPGGREFAKFTVLQGSKIPVVYLTVNAKELSKVNKSKDNIITEGHVVYQEADGTVSYDGPIESFKARGNSTFGYSNKKPYQLKLEQKTNLSGMGKAKTWILLANWMDLSLLRNRIVMDFARQLDMRFALSCVPVDFYINGEYNGMYLLAEKVQIHKKRVDITDLGELTEAANPDTDLSKVKKFRETDKKTGRILRGYAIENNPEDITGGYLLEIQKPGRFDSYAKSGFKTEEDLYVVVKEPSEASREQVAYISDLVNDFHIAAYAEDGISPATGKAYSEYIDMNSFARKFWLDEFCENYDMLAASQYMYKDSDSVDPLLYAGPVWDYDLCLGNVNIIGHMTAAEPEGDYVTWFRKNNNLLGQLYKHEDFHALLEEMYPAAARAMSILIGDTEAEEGDIIRSIADYAAEIEKSAKMNFTRWPESTVFGYYDVSGTTHEASVSYLETFIRRRKTYLDGVWAK